MYHVFSTVHGIKAVDTTGCNSVEEVEAVLSGNGWGGQNWFGATASTHEGAIEEAHLAGFKDVSPEVIGELKQRLARLFQDERSVWPEGVTLKTRMTKPFD